MEVVRIAPIDAHLSFAARTVYAPNINQLIILWMTAYHLPLAVTNPTWIDEPLIEQATRNTMEFMRTKSI